MKAPSRVDPLLRRSSPRSMPMTSSAAARSRNRRQYRLLPYPHRLCDITPPDTAELRIRQAPAEENVNLLRVHALPLLPRREQHSLRPGRSAARRRRPCQASARRCRDSPSLLSDPRQARPQPSPEMHIVGSLIQGRVTVDIKDRNKLLVPAGASVRGRIRRLEQYRENGGYFIVGLEFTDLDWEGSHARFFAELQDMDHRDGIDWFLQNSASQTRRVSPDLSETTSYNETLRTASLPGVGTFFVRAGRLHLPEGFKTTWKTTK